MPPRDFLLGEIPAEAIKFNVIFCCPTMFINAVCVLFLRSTLGERFVIFGDPVVDGIPVHARREDSRFWLLGRAMFKICAILNNY